MLNKRIQGGLGPTESELQAIAKDAYERMLSELCREQRSTPYHAQLFSMSNLAFANYYQTLADNGGHSSMILSEERRLVEAGWDAQQIDDQKAIIKLREDWGFTRFQPDYIGGLLLDHGFTPKDRLRYEVQLTLYPAFRDAHLDADKSLGLQLSSLQPNMLVGPTPVPVSVADAPIDRSSIPSIPSDWLEVTPTQPAERTIADNPKTFERRRKERLKEEQTGEQTLRQIRWAANLLERTIGGRLLWTLTFEDLRALDVSFERLPISCGKAPWHRLPETTLEQICVSAEEKVGSDECEADSIGLLGATTNKHFRKIAQVHSFLKEHATDVASIDFSKFMVPDQKDERKACEAYSIDQGKELLACRRGPAVDQSGSA